MIPDYWKTDLNTIAEWANRAKKAEVRVLGKSAGGRDIWLFAYGEKEDLHPKANYNSACGAKDVTAYVDRKNKKPVILLAGAIHGQETEGTAALMNLISLLETGKDLAGNPNQELVYWASKVRLLIIPVVNADGRAHVKPAAMIGLTYEEFRHWGQGRWKDGSLCEWPDCKRVHPIKDAVSFLGGYFNDDGVNLMHDQMFNPMARETKLLFELAEQEILDCSLLLHGGANDTNDLLQPQFVPLEVNQAVQELAERCDLVARKEGLTFKRKDLPGKECGECSPSFNLTSAMHHVTGAVSATFESNEAIVDHPGEKLTYDEILRSHAILFEQVCRMFVERQSKK